MAKFLIETVELPSWLAYLISAFIHSVLLVHVIAVGALVFIWLERKIAGRIQDRLGPTRIGGKFGWLQTLADGIKLIQKEDLLPGAADGFLFRMAPYISFCAAFIVYLALPFSDGWVAVNLNIAIFFILAVMGLEVFGVILAGYASASKWSLFGCMREAAQVVSYEVPMGICVVIPVLVVGSMNLTQISNFQAGFVNNWIIFHDPFCFITFWVYFTCAMASVNRAPFDLAEAESELVAGFHTEYSGIRWSFFFMAEYGSMFTVSALATLLFFGGWNGPIPVTHMLGLVEGGVVETFLADNLGIAGIGVFLGNLCGLVNFIGKAVTLVIVMMWIRWTLPRIRIDQVMKMCLKYCVPISCAMLLGVTCFRYAVPGGGPWRGNPSFGEGWKIAVSAEILEESHSRNQPPVITIPVEEPEEGDSEEEVPKDKPTDEKPEEKVAEIQPELDVTQNTNDTTNSLSQR